MNGAMWIADLLACGLLKASFVPPEEIQELRSLMRTRKQLVREQTRHVQRIEKTLEEANINPGFNPGDLMGVSGRRMIEAMIPTGHVWMARGSQGFFRVPATEGRLRSCVRPVVAAGGRRP
jgi:hypothetical protein